jgi:diamine N-acetyltransferase
MVSLRPLSDSNRPAAEALRLSPGQERFVSSVAESLREAAEHPGARAIYWVVDERYQRQGFGTATLDLIVEYFRGRPRVEAVSTRAHPGDGSPIAFYERYGFERTGEVLDDEVLLRLELR